MGRQNCKCTVTQMGAIILFGLLIVLLLMSGCSIPREGIVIDHTKGTYQEITCDAYQRTPIDRAILLCEVQP